MGSPYLVAHDVVRHCGIINWKHTTMIPSTNRAASGPSIDLSAIKADAQKHLFKLLDKFEGTKTIVWDDKLIGPFEFVANGNLLKQHDAIRMVRLSDARLSFNTDFALIFIRKDYQIVRLVAEMLLRVDRESLSKISLVLVPQRCQSIEKLLEQNKIDLSRLNSIEELPIELFVMDSDLLSLENEFVYRDMHLNEDYSACHQIAEGLTKLQNIYGTIPRISGQGKGAKLVCDLLVRRRKLNPVSVSRTRCSQISQLILIDRRIDLITPLLTQLTYEGLLDEVFNINHGTLTLPADKFQKLDEQQKQGTKQQQAPEKLKDTKRFELRSSEELFARLRDCHINSVANTLKQSAKNLQAEYDECTSDGKTIHEMGKIVKRLNQLKMAKNSQSNHVTIAELLNEQTLSPEFIIGLRIEHELLQEDRTNRIVPDIETKLIRQEPSWHVLRLICLQSIINNGIKPKICDYYKREILQNYGDDYLLFMMQLEKAKLLLSRERFYETGSFNQLKGRFNLINDNIDECNPNHLSYVYGGYAPLSVMTAKALTQSTQTSQWRSLSENLKLLHEPTVNYTEPTTIQTTTSMNTLPISISNEFSTSNSLTSNAVAAASMLLSATSVASGAPSLRVRRNSATSSQSSSEETRIILVFFIGGCTFAEISALRFLSQQEENNCEFIVGTTKVINGRSFLKSMWPLNGRSVPE